MANYRAISSSNWDSLATWEDDSLGYFAASSVLPTSADDVYSNTFTVNVNQNITVNSLRNTAFSSTYLASMSIPQMTSNNAPSGSVSTSSLGSGSAWNAFDRNTGTFWQSSNVAGQWVSYQFPTGKIIKRYAFFSGSNNPFNPRTWTFEGSVNGSTWVILDTQTNFVTGVSTWYSFDISANTTSYTYYRINVSAVQGGGSNATIIPELEMSEVTNLYGSASAGGSFNFNTVGVVASATSVSQGATNFLQVTNATGTVSLSVSSNITAVSVQNTISYTGAGDFTFTCPNLYMNNSSTGTTTVINKTGAGNLIVNGNPITNPFVSNNNCFMYLINSTNGNVTINGNVIGNSSPSQSGGTTFTIRQTAGNLTINGNVTPCGIISGFSQYSTVFFSGSTLTLNGNTLGGDGCSINSSGTVNATGTLVGGNSIYANGTIAINVTGDVYAGLQPAINCSAFTASTVTLTGNQYNNLGRMAIWCPNIFISNTATTLWRMDTGGGNYKFLYSADTTPNLPPTTDVRSGTTFGPALSLTGTMVVASAANTRKDVPTDNTVGTGELTSADIISGINASSDPLAVRMKNILTDVTAGNIISQYNNS